MKSPDITSKRRRELRQQIRQTDFEQADKSFVERSATDAIMLVLAFQRFPNLRELWLPCIDVQDEEMSIRRKQNGEGPSMDHVFSMLLSSAAHANTKLQSIRMSLFCSSIHDEGVSISTLSMPKEMLCSLSELRRLKLRLQTRSSSCRNPATWQSHLATFLSRCPQLCQLDLSFRNHWEDTERIFSIVAARVRLSHLERLSLDGLRCSGDDLSGFLHSHADLRGLTLEDFDITGETSYASILEMLSRTHASLRTFKCGQIAQNSYRLYFKSLGMIETRSHRYFLSEEPADFFDDFEYVGMPFKYITMVEAWEDAQQRLALMSEDLVVSGLSYHPEHDFGEYHWAY